MFAWTHFWTLAVRLADQKNAQESDERASVGRAYYAAYGEVREHAIRCGLQFAATKPSHEQVWQFMRSGGGQQQQYKAAASKHVGDLGIALRALRTQADYFKSPALTKDEVRMAIGMSREILNRLQKI